MYPNSSSLNQYGISFKLKKNQDVGYVISGKFKIQKNEKYDLHRKLQASIVMVITTPVSFFSSNPFHETFIFKDDVKYSEHYISGSFNINISQVIQDMQAMRFNILFSMGEYLSNIEKIVIDT